MAFNRDAAKAAGYSDQEIDEYLSAKPEPGPRTSAVHNGIVPGLLSAGLPIAGGLVGSFGGPIGTMAGAGLGGALAERMRQQGQGMQGNPTEPGIGALQVGGAGLLSAGLAGIPSLLGLLRPAAGPAAKMILTGERAGHAKDAMRAIGAGQRAASRAKIVEEPIEAVMRTRPQLVPRPSAPDFSDIEQGVKAIGRAEPAAAKAGSAASRAKPYRPPKVKAPAKGTAASRVKPKPKLQAVKGTAASRVAAGPEGSRHNIQYFSESKGKFEPIEEMPISHLRHAMNKLYTKLTASDRPSPVTKEQFDALAAEVTHRLNQAGELTVP